MNTLPQTEAALAEFRASEDYMFGIHEGNEPRTGAVGRDLGDVTFNPLVHSPLDINPLSIWEPVYGEPQVRITIPERPLHVNLITQERASVAGDILGINETKRQLANELRTTISESLPGMTDRTWSYAIGEGAAAHKSADIEVLDTSGNPLVEAKTIAELCREGLTFVISDFLDLPLEIEARENFPATVAVKANHPFDIALPEGVGVLPTSYNGGEVNTDKSRQLRKVNQAQAELHQHTVQQLERVGIAVAHVIFNRRDNPIYGFDTAVADSHIATALQSLQA